MQFTIIYFASENLHVVFDLQFANSLFGEADKFKVEKLLHPREHGMPFKWKTSIKNKVLCRKTNSRRIKNFSSPKTEKI